MVPSNEETHETSPSEQLANEITKALLDANLIPAEEKAIALSTIHSGTARAEDWRIWADKKVLREEKSDDGTTKN